MDLNLSGKVVVVTGASKGIGLAIVKAMASEGALVVAGARSVDSLASVPGVSALAVDLATAEGPAQLVQHAVEKHGRLDVLVNNMGAVRLRTEGFGTSDEEFAWAMNVNFYSAVRACRAAITQMLTQGGGNIVSTTSVNAFFQPDGGTVDYGAAKAALVNLSKSLAQEFGPRGIRVNCVSPGPVSTELWIGKGGVAATAARAMGVDEDTARQRVVASIGGFATQRFTTPEEVAALIVMLASDCAGNITGSQFVIDGGLIKTT